MSSRENQIWSPVEDAVLATFNNWNIHMLSRTLQRSEGSIRNRLTKHVKDRTWSSALRNAYVDKFPKPNNIVTVRAFVDSKTSSHTTKKIGETKAPSISGRAKNFNWTKEKIAILNDMSNAGALDEKIAEVIGCTKWQIRRARVQVINNPKHKTWTEADEQLLIALWKDGKDLNSMCLVLGRKINAVKVRLCKLNLSIKGRTSPPTSSNPQKGFYSESDKTPVQNEAEIKPARLIDNVTTNNLNAACHMVGISGVPTHLLDKIIDLVEVLEEKGDNFSIDDANKLKTTWNTNNNF